MRAFVLSIVAMAAISAGAWYGLSLLGFSSEQFYASTDTRPPGMETESR